MPQPIDLIGGNSGGAANEDVEDRGKGEGKQSGAKHNGAYQAEDCPIPFIFFHGFYHTQSGGKDQIDDTYLNAPKRIVYQGKLQKLI